MRTMRIAVLVGLLVATVVSAQFIPAPGIKGVGKDAGTGITLCQLGDKFVDCDPDATHGGCVTLKESIGAGGGWVQICMPDTGITPGTRRIVLNPENGSLPAGDVGNSLCTGQAVLFDANGLLTCASPAVPTTTTSTSSSTTSTSSTSTTSSTVPGATTSTSTSTSSTTVTTTTSTSTTSTTILSQETDLTNKANTIGWYTCDGDTQNHGGASSCGGTPANCDLTGGTWTPTYDSSTKMQGSSACHITSGSGPGSASALLAPTAPFFLMGWVEDNDTSGFPSWMFNDNYTSGFEFSYGQASQVAQFAVRFGSTFSASPTASVPLDSYHFVLGGYNGTSPFISVDGGTLLTGPPGNYAPNPSPTLRLGPTGQTIVGYLDGLLVYKAAPTAALGCYGCSVDPDHALSKCDPAAPANYKTCAADADCGGTTGSCDTFHGKCMGRNHTQCHDCTLPACNFTAP